jgi:hypothetical protein
MRNRSMGIVGMATMGAALMSVIASPRGMHVAGPPRSRGRSAGLASGTRPSCSNEVQHVRSRVERLGLYRMPNTGMPAPAKVG